MTESTKRRFLKFTERPENVRSILVVRNGLIGDTVFIIPVLERLRQTFSNADLDVAVSSKSLPVLEGTTFLNAVHAIPDRYSFMDHSRFFMGLRKRRYDIAVVQEVNSHYVATSRLAAPKFLAGFENKLGVFLDYSVSRPKHCHAIDAELEAVREWTRERGAAGTRVDVSTEEENEAARLLAKKGIRPGDPFVCIHPGCSGSRAKKEWMPEHYSVLADMLIEHGGVKVVFDGIERDRPLVESIVAHMSRTPVTMIGETNIRQLLGVIRLSQVVVGPDTGVCHLANAVGTPVVMLFGPTDPADTGPFDPSGKSRYLRADMKCLGCFNRTRKPAQWSLCKNIYPVVCMKELAPQKVFADVLEVLNSKGKVSPVDLAKKTSPTRILTETERSSYG